MVVLAVAAAAAVAFLQGGNLVVVDVATQHEHIAMRHAGTGPVRWSGDGKLVSSGGKVAGGPTLPTAQLTWAPTGETAAYTTRKGGAGVWSKTGGIRRIVPDGWGASTVAWSGARQLAIGRSVCCGEPTNKEIWVWNGHAVRRVLRLVSNRGVPTPVAWDRGRVVWWEYPESNSVAADGVYLYAGARRIGATLMYRDYVTSCGPALAIADGGDRYATHGKRILLDGRDVSRDASRSWVSPACSANGSVLVAAAGRNWEETRFGLEHRAIWQLLPTKRRLTNPPSGWTDELPTVLSDGSILFVRTHQTSFKRNGVWYATDHGKLERLSNGRVRPVADVTDTSDALDDYYGHYAWSWQLSVTR